MEAGKILGKHGNELKTDVLLHPGEVLRMEIDARKIKKTDLAEALNLKRGNLTELLQGKRHVSAVLALRLEAVFGINASFWLGVQTDYDLAVAKQDFSKSLYAKLKKNSKMFRAGLEQH
jgi:antitoxin HigA-1